MERLLIFLIFVFLIGGGVTGIFYQEQQKNDSQAVEESVTMSEAEEMAKEAADTARAEVREEYEKKEQQAKEAEEKKEKQKKEKKDKTEKERAAEIAAEAEKEVSREDQSKEEDSEKKDSEEKDGETQYYSYEIKGVTGSVNIHSTPDGQNDVIATVGEGVKGYVIERGEPRTLVLSGGKIGYISNLYVEISELDESKYPKKLKGMSAADVGKEVDL